MVIVLFLSSCAYMDGKTDPGFDIQLEFSGWTPTAGERAAIQSAAARWERIITEDVEVALQSANVSGITLWHFFDFKVNDAAENHTACQYAPGVFPPTCTSITLSFRPGGENHKGVVDFWRRPKPAYAQVAARYNASRLRAQGQVYGQPLVEA